MSRLSKNIGPFNYFGKRWFAANQRPLLWLLNGPAKPLARWLLRIRPCDVPLREPICQITPNSFSYGLRPVGDRWQITTDFRTHAKYAKRVYSAAKPLWWLAHAWDMGIANPFRPAWNLGFDTLTAYPDPDPETNTVDGFVRNSGANWAIVRAGTSGDQVGDAGGTMYFAGEFNDPTYVIYRHFYLFDTSAIADTNTISAATFSVTYDGTGIQNEVTNPANLSLVSSNPASNTELALGDFDTLGTTKYASDVTLAAFIAAGANNYSDFAMNGDGLAIISKTGVTKLGLRPSNDFDDSHAPTQRTLCNMNTAGAGAETDPKLVVTHAAAAGGIPKHMDYYRRMRLK